MNPIALLKRPGVSVDWANGQLKLRFVKGGLTKHEIETLRQNKPLVGGRLLLDKLWQAGYTLHLQRRSDGEGYFIVPRGQAHPGVDFPSLFELYDTFHDQAVALLLDMCRLGRIHPEDFNSREAWPIQFVDSNDQVLCETKGVATITGNKADKGRG